MLVLPVTFSSEKLDTFADFAAIQLKQQLVSAVAPWAREALNDVKSRVFFSVGIKDCGDVSELNVSLVEPFPSTDETVTFSAMVPMETVSLTQFGVRDAIHEHLTRLAVERRLKEGRELLEAEEDEVREMSEWTFRCGSDQRENARYFMAFLACRELELRKTSLSNHQTLAERKKLAELRKRLGEEAERAVGWWNALTPKEQGRANPFKHNKIPEHEQIVLSHRHHRMEHYGYLPGLNAWGEIAPSKPSKVDRLMPLKPRTIRVCI